MGCGCVMNCSKGSLRKEKSCEFCRLPYFASDLRTFGLQSSRPLGRGLRMGTRVEEPPYRLLFTSSSNPRSHTTDPQRHANSKYNSDRPMMQQRSGEATPGSVKRSPHPPGLMARNPPVPKLKSRCELARLSESRPLLSLQSLRLSKASCW